jgi:hypothetical protein
MKTQILFGLFLGFLFLNTSQAATSPELTARCVGGVQRPQVVLEWKYRQGATANGLQKGDMYPNDPNQFWGELANNPQSNLYFDTYVQYGKTYTYRVKYSPSETSNSAQVTINESYCGTGLTAPSQMTARCTGGIRNPQVVAEWSDGPGDLNSLQKGFTDPQFPNNNFWNFLNNNQSLLSYVDTDINAGMTYSYRVKYTPNSSSNVAQIPITKAWCGRQTLPYYFLTAHCEGGNNPKVVLAWGTADSTLENTINVLQRGDAYPNDDSQFWGFLNNDPKLYTFSDDDIYFGETYSYRVKYTPNVVSNSVEFKVTPEACGVKR